MILDAIVSIMTSPYWWLPAQPPTNPQASFTKWRSTSSHVNIETETKCPHFADDIFKCFFWNENILISINNQPALVQIMAWCRAGDKPYIWTNDAQIYWRMCDLSELTEKVVGNAKWSSILCDMQRVEVLFSLWNEIWRERCSQILSFPMSFFSLPNQSILH